MIKKLKDGFISGLKQLMKYQQKITGFLFFIVVCGVFMFVIKHKNEQDILTNQSLLLENQILKARQHQDQMKSQLIYYIMLQQADSLSYYKSKLINCQLQQLDEYDNQRKR